MSALQLQDKSLLATALAVGGLAAFVASPWGQSTRDRTSSLFSSLFTFTSTKTIQHYDEDLSFDDFLQQQSRIAWQHLRDNIHPSGTAPGCVVASPSKSKPDYWYQMSVVLIDSALVMRAVVQRWKSTSKGTQEEQDLTNLLLDFVDATIDMQHRDTPSGGFTSGGLGEVKFYVNRDPFTGSWGRPQRDGPALRATLLMAFAQHYTSSYGDLARKLVDEKLWKAGVGAINADLDYVASEWAKPDFDLWEESQGTHFYTLVAQLRAMRNGADFARRQGDSDSVRKYTATANEMESTLEQFWDKDRGYLRVTINVVDDHGKKSGLDTATIMAILHAGTTAGQWTVDNPKVLLTQEAVVESMRHTYPLSDQYSDQYAAPMGRYCEDIYDGVDTSRANPWYLCTLYHAEYLYRLALKLEGGPINVPEETRGFYSSLLISPLAETTTTIPLESPVHAAVTSGLRARADEFVDIVRQWKAPDGSLSEQFSRIDGYPQGAYRLTWSYAAFLSMLAARNGAPPF